MILRQLVHISRYIDKKNNSFRSLRPCGSSLFLPQAKGYQCFCSAYSSLFSQNSKALYREGSYRKAGSLSGHKLILS